MRRWLLGALAVAMTAASPGASRADATCVLRATPTMPKTTSLFAGATSGDALATFTGQPIVLTATVTGGGRARVRTGGGFRLEGYVDAAALPLFLTRNVPVVEGHVWLGGGRPVTAVGAKGDAIEVELRAGSPVDQVVRAPASCTALSLEQPSFKHPPPPGEARGWRIRKIPLGIAKEAGGDAAFRLTGAAAKDALLFWSTEKREQSVHVLFAGDVVIDGWASAADLEALPEGELLDAVGPAKVSTKSARLSVQGTPTKVKVAREVPLFAQAKDGADRIGAIEIDGEVLVLDTVAGWSSVIPASLTLMPADGRAFWTKAADLK